MTYDGYNNHNLDPYKIGHVNIKKVSKTALKVSSIKFFQEMVVYPTSLHGERLLGN